MRIIIIYNKDLNKVISKLGPQNSEIYRESTIQKVEQVFLKRGFEVRTIDGNLDMFEYLRKMKLEQDRIPFVFNLAYGIQGENRYTHIPSILEMLGLPYLGSGPLGHTLALDKITSKIIMQAHGIPTPEFIEYPLGEEIHTKTEFPVIVKPAMGSDSEGLTVARNEYELKGAVEHIFDEFSQTAFAEKFISGREFGLALIGNRTKLECLPLVEINLDNNPGGIYSTEIKSMAKDKKVPDDIANEVLLSMQEKARKLFSLLRLRDYARIDIRLNDRGEFYFLEVNSMASLGPSGSLMAAAQTAGYTYDDTIIKLLETAVEKYFDTNQKLKVRYESKYARDRN
ncbi:MAG: D-alanine--D-alanine ligase family protein [Mariniphaga sp.]